MVLASAAVVGVYAATREEPSVPEDSGITACKDMSEDGTSPLNHPSSGLIADDSAALRKQFSDSKYRDIRTHGVRLVDALTKSLQGGSDEAWVTQDILTLTESYAGLTRACAAQGIAVKPIGPPDSRSSEAPLPQETASIGQVFRSGTFEVTVTKVELGVMEIPHESGAYRPERGHFILVWLTVKNIGTASASFSELDSGLIDGDGLSHVIRGDGYPGVKGNTLGQANRPGTSGSGPLIFDVPTSVQKVSRLQIHSGFAASDTPPTAVNIG